jgi:hypothetical protein
MEMGMRIIHLGRIFVHKRIISAAKKVEFVSDRIYLMPDI